MRTSEKRKAAIVAAVLLAAEIVVLFLVAGNAERSSTESAEQTEAAAETATDTEKSESVEILPGYIEQSGISSQFTENLFLKVGDRYLIRASAIDETTNAHAIRAAEGYAVTNGFSQTAMPTNKKYYTNGTKRVEDDTNYIPPRIVGDEIFVDTDTLFGCFGYTTEYAVSVTNDMVRLILHGTGNDIYDVIEIRKDVRIDREAGPDESDETGTAEPALSTEDETESRPPEDLKIEDTENPKYTEKELEEIWNEKKQSLQDVFKKAVPAAGNIPYCERGENIIAFNPMQRAIMVDTVCVSRPELSEEIFLTADFSGEWSDQASRTDEENRAFYDGLPGIYEETLKQVLGENEGEQFYLWIKEHADKILSEGYFSSVDESGTHDVQWRNEPCGDGVASYALDFGRWYGHMTDYELYYDASIYANGFRVTVYR